MPLFTKTGEMTRADAPPNRNGLFERMWRGALLGSFVSGRWMSPLLFWRVREIEMSAENEPEPEDPWHGLTQAELTPEQEHEAQEEAAREWQHHDR